MNEFWQWYYERVKSTHYMTNEQFDNIVSEYYT